MFRRKFGVIRVPLVVLTATVATISLASPLRASDVRSGASPGAALSQHKLSAIDEFINGAIASGKIPGAIVLIQHHGQPVYFKCFGQGDVEKGTAVTADTIFPLHSLTKTVTSVAAMNSPSQRMHVQVGLKKIIYDAFEK